jgi:hypothetical protein
MNRYGPGLVERLVSAALSLLVVAVALRWSLLLIQPVLPALLAVAVLLTLGLIVRAVVRSRGVW